MPVNAYYLSVPELKDILQFVAQKANAPLVNQSALRQAFAPQPATFKALPQFYLQHLKQVFSDPKKLRLALTDITPLSLVTNALSVPATLKLLKMYPHRKAETISGAIGNVLGGQVMQRTGIIGGLLGGLGGEALGRLVARPFAGSRKQAPNPLAERLQKIRDTGQKIDAILGAAQEKLSADTAFGPGAGGSDGMQAPLQSTTDASIGGPPPDLQDIPGQQGNRHSISNRGKTIGTGDTLLGELIRLLGTGTVESHRAGDPLGQHVDFDPLFDGETATAIPGNVPTKVRS